MGIRWGTGDSVDEALPTPAAANTHDEPVSSSSRSVDGWRYVGYQAARKLIAAKVGQFLRMARYIAIHEGAPPGSR
jgi:hypothetical protein